MSAKRDDERNERHRIRLLRRLAESVKAGNTCELCGKKIRGNRELCFACQVVCAVPIRFA